jgi:Pup amidohydrolase
MARQICGTEMEWGVEIALSPEELELRPGQTGLVVPEFHDIYRIIDKPPLPREAYNLGLRKRNEQLSNGGRLYIDHAHPETSTTELDTLDDVAAAEIGDEQLTLEYFIRARREGVITDFVLRKCVRGDNASWGYHENYLIEREVLDITAARRALLSRIPLGNSPEELYKLEHAKKLELIGLHLATRNIFGGAGTLLSVNEEGKISEEGQDLRFVIGQKTSHLTEEYSESTMFDKAVVNLRDNPYADPEQWSRLHVTSADPTMSPWATKMKIGTTSLVLDMLRYGIPLRCGTVAEPEARKSILLEKGDLLGLARHTGEDVTCKRAYRFKDKRERTPLQIQYAILEGAKQVAQFKELTDDDRWVLEQWQQALDDISDDPMKLQDRSDWVRRYKIIEGYKARMVDKGKAPDYKMMRKLNQSFDRIWEDRETLSEDDEKFWRVSGMAARLSIWKHWMPSEELIRERRVRAPKHLRGHGRGRLVVKFCDEPARNEGLLLQRWNKFILRNGTEVPLPDPAEPTSPEAEYWLARR